MGRLEPTTYRSRSKLNQWTVASGPAALCDKKKNNPRNRSKHVQSAIHQNTFSFTHGGESRDFYMINYMENGDEGQYKGKIQTIKTFINNELPHKLFQHLKNFLRNKSILKW